MRNRYRYLLGMIFVYSSIVAACNPNTLYVNNISDDPNVQDSFPNELIALEDCNTMEINVAPAGANFNFGSFTIQSPSLLTMGYTIGTGTQFPVATIFQTVSILVNGNYTLSLGIGPTDPGMIVLTDLTVDGGTLNLAIGNITLSKVILQNGTFDLNFAANTVQEIVVNGVSTINFNNQIISAPIPLITMNSGAVGAEVVINANFGGGATIQQIVGDGVVSFTGANTITVSGQCTNTGYTIVNNPGRLVLAGAADISVSGQTFLYGVIDLTQATQAVTLSNFNGTGQLIIGAEDLFLTNSTDSGFSGMIQGSGTGAVNIAGSGFLTFGQQNTYTGATVISGGLVLQSLGAIANSASVTIVGGGSLDISETTLPVSINQLSGDGSLSLGSKSITINNDIGNLVYSGFISDGGFGLGVGGSIQKIGNGTLNLTGTNSYTGPTTIDGGTLAIGAVGAIGPQSEVTNNAILDCSIGSNPTLLNYSGSGTASLGAQTLPLNYTKDITTTSQFTGNGVVQKSGDFKLNLTAATMPFSGTFQLMGGQLGVNGSFNNMIIDSAVGTTVYGNGIVAAMTNAGTLAPGNSVGVITIVGNYVQTGTLLIELTSLGASDRVDVGNNINISGSALRVNAAPGLYPVGQLYTIMNFGGTRTGTFGSQNIPARFDLSVQYNANNIQLLNNKKIHVLPIEPTGLGDYAGAMAAALFCDDVPSGQALDQMKDTILRLPGVEFVGALDHLVPGQMSAFPLIELENNDRFAALLQNRIYRFNEQKCGSSGELPDWTLWVTPTTFWMWQQGNRDAFHFSLNTTGFGIGFENNCYENLLAGFGAGYTHTGLHWVGSLGKGYMNEVYMGPYLGGRWENCYFAGSILGSYDAVEMQRVLQFSNYYFTGVTHFNQWNLTTMLNFKAVVNPNKTGNYILPEGSIAFEQLFRQSATESGADVFNMVYPGEFNSTMRVFLNLGTGYRTCLDEDLTLDGRVCMGYQNTQLFTSNNVKANFLDESQYCTNIDIYGNLPSVNQGVLGLSIDLQQNDLMKGELKGSYTFGGRSTVIEVDFSFERTF